MQRLAVFSKSSSVKSVPRMIPEKFVRKYGGELQGGVLLKAPGAPPWSVDLQREEGKVWLRNGWPQFAKFYSVCIGHFIFFEYQGNCNFKVVIFDTSTTEIDYPVQFEERSGSDQLQVFKRKQVHSGCSAACYLGDSLKRKLVKEKIAEALSETSNSDDEEEHGGIEKPSHANGTPPDIPMRQHVVKAKGVSSPAEEKDRALARAKSLKSIHPSFKVVMQPSYVGKTYGLYLRKSCLVSYIRRGVDVLIFRVARRSWVVKCRVVRSNRLKLGCGWQQFAEDNALKVGDVCVFELVSPSKKLIDVVIDRAAVKEEEEEEDEEDDVPKLVTLGI